MTPRVRRRPAQSRARRQPRILVFGEDENDTKVIATLIGAACPSLKASIKAFRRPPVLVRDAQPEQLPDRVAQIAALIDAEAVDGDVLAVFLHEDCDAVEPAHVALSSKIEAAFMKNGYQVIGVAPAWEMEAWLFQWPNAVAAHRSKWRSVASYRGRNVGLIVDAKEELIRALRPQGSTGGAVRDYRESDAPAIALQSVKSGEALAPAAWSASSCAFITQAQALCPGQRLLSCASNATRGSRPPGSVCPSLRA